MCSSREKGREIVNNIQKYSGIQIYISSFSRRGNMQGRPVANDPVADTVVWIA
jgi:hypothetical protein